ncbi:hypothetical protein T11_9116 [Trichinella zimbabwensis]|uniref:Uncharacterized protein n=1 Tax=Trichinella zimbabwensis TaxID=268475 RepID=A0A0V1H5I7_9BILA|nr:hypothetical protein T11_9116 [Trichinella zimbabwensis]
MKTLKNEKEKDLSAVKFLPNNNKARWRNGSASDSRSEGWVFKSLTVTENTSEEWQGNLTTLDC